jgi:hypothetical protein
LKGKRGKKLNPYIKVDDQIFLNFKVALEKEKLAFWLHTALFGHLNWLDTTFGLA